MNLSGALDTEHDALLDELDVAGQELRAREIDFARSRRAHDDLMAKLGNTASAAGRVPLQTINPNTVTLPTHAPTLSAKVLGASRRTDDAPITDDVRVRCLAAIGSDNMDALVDIVMDQTLPLRSKVTDAFCLSLSSQMGALCSVNRSSKLREHTQSGSPRAGGPAPLDGTWSWPPATGRPSTALPPCPSVPLWRRRRI